MGAVTHVLVKFQRIWWAVFEKTWLQMNEWTVEQNWFYRLSGMTTGWPKSCTLLILNTNTNYIRKILKKYTILKIYFAMKGQDILSRGEHKEYILLDTSMPDANFVKSLLLISNFYLLISQFHGHSGNLISFSIYYKKYVPHGSFYSIFSPLDVIAWSKNVFSS